MTPIELLKRYDDALALIESMTDTINDGENPYEKLRRAIRIAHNVRFYSGLIPREVKSNGRA